MKIKHFISVLVVIFLAILASGCVQKSLSEKKGDSIKCPPGKIKYFSNCSCSYECVDKIPELDCMRECDTLIGP